MNIQVDTSSSSPGTASVSYEFLGASGSEATGVLSLDQSKMLSTTAYSSYFNFSRETLRSQSRSTQRFTSLGTRGEGAVTASVSELLGSSSSPATSSVSAARSSSSAAGQLYSNATNNSQTAAGASFKANWKLGAAMAALMFCGVLV